MAALTGADVVKHKEPAILVLLPVVASDIIYQGALCMLNAAGFITPATPTASTTFGGIASETVDNSGGAAGDLSVLMFISGLHQMDITGVAVTDVMDDAGVFAETDNAADVTIGAASTANAQKCGKIVSLESGTTLAWVDISVGINQQELGT